MLKKATRAIDRTPEDWAAEFEVGGADLNQILPLEVIREHTKTDDIPAVTDTLLLLYRAAAFEAAERYLGLSIVDRRTITENVSPPSYRKWGQNSAFFEHRTRHPFGQPFAFYYGHKNEAPRRIDVVVGENTVILPIIMTDFGLGCCNPCATPTQPRLQYSTGGGCKKAIQPTLVLGVLKYIAHVLENPGDVVKTQNSNGGKSTDGTVYESNNPAVASGAVEIWNLLRNDII